MHILINGSSGSGKSSLARYLCKLYRRTGVESIVYDPSLSQNWGASFVTNDKEKFIKMVWASKKCLIIVDEAPSWGKNSKELQDLACMSRHRGHKVIFMGQKCATLNSSVRENCTELYVLRSSKKSCILLADDFACDEIQKAYGLQNHEYWYFNCKDPKLYKGKTKKDW
jgi:energy-coupling factor transporter ATP-binding protein EcfA2